jgi:hypothetical protein
MSAIAGLQNVTGGASAPSGLNLRSNLRTTTDGLQGEEAHDGQTP